MKPHRPTGLEIYITLMFGILLTLLWSTAMGYMQ
jgi:hypothetical protein